MMERTKKESGKFPKWWNEPKNRTENSQNDGTNQKNRTENSQNDGTNQKKRVENSQNDGTNQTEWWKILNGNFPSFAMIHNLMMTHLPNFGSDYRSDDITVTKTKTMTHDSDKLRIFCYDNSFLKLRIKWQINNVRQ